jgi:hypothetical protein
MEYIQKLGQKSNFASGQSRRVLEILALNSVVSKTQLMLTRVVTVVLSIFLKSNLNRSVSIVFAMQMVPSKQ